MSIQQSHWENVYATKGEDEVSWFQENPAPSLALLDRLGVDRASPIIDVGGGASRLVDRLLEKGFRNLTVLDLSESALTVSRARIGPDSDRVTWVPADVTRWETEETFALWHDRGAFHFLTEAQDRAAYISRLHRFVRRGGYAIIATFAPDGPERCSGLPILRYDSASLAAAIGEAFTLVSTEPDVHVTPWGSEQRFQFSVFRRSAED